MSLLQHYRSLSFEDITYTSENLRKMKAYKMPVILDFIYRGESFF